MCLCESAIPIPFFFFKFLFENKTFVWVQKGDRSRQVGSSRYFPPSFVVAEPSYIN